MEHNIVPLKHANGARARSRKQVQDKWLGRDVQDHARASSSMNIEQFLPPQFVCAHTNNATVKCV